ncbi:hypothetical protein EI94DRAFT_762641 [Lactarius quietus]|nr:hypothetical protein EI94DRAFT_762641 [Lactarius quietus]
MSYAAVGRPGICHNSTSTEGLPSSGRFLSLLRTINPSPSMSVLTLEADPVSKVILPEIQKDESTSVPVTAVTSQSYDEPVVTRRELWSYYRFIFLWE